MQQNYQDAMTIVRNFGKPDLFITFTCNPNWPEIKESLLPNQNAFDRPDIAVRVFNLKFQNFIDDLTKNDVLGKVVAYIYVIEFQKRGLPHAHILLILRDEDKFRTAEDIDYVVWAEIPNQIKNPDLYKIVTENMIHGPCGDINPKASCMDPITKCCTKQFPKEFVSETKFNDNGFPLYKRNQITYFEKTIRNQKIKLDNRWVVPYCPKLSLKYGNHINVEICSSIQSVKYLFKYVYKGQDKCNNIIIQSVENGQNLLQWDEIKTYMGNFNYKKKF